MPVIPTRDRPLHTIGGLEVKSSRYNSDERCGVDNQGQRDLEVVDSKSTRAFGSSDATSSTTPRTKERKFLRRSWCFSPKDVRPTDATSTNVLESVWNFPRSKPLFLKCPI